MRFDVLTLFPAMFEAYMSESIIGRARQNEILQVVVHNIRDFANDKHKITDDYPFGGGSGMVMKIEPMAAAIEHAALIGDEKKLSNRRVILTSPAGKQLTQDIVKDLARYDQLIILCGHYEGVDERVTSLITDEISIGDYVLTGGELPAMVLIDSVSRMIEGVLGAKESAINDSFYNSLLDYPHYTRPREWRGMCVPEVLISGDHKKIDRHRLKESLKRTLLRRPDIFKKLVLNKEEQAVLSEIKEEENLLGD